MMEARCTRQQSYVPAGCKGENGHTRFFFFFSVESQEKQAKDAAEARRATAAAAAAAAAAVAAASRRGNSVTNLNSNNGRRTDPRTVATQGGSRGNYWAHQVPGARRDAARGGRGVSVGAGVAEAVTVGLRGDARGARGGGGVGGSRPLRWTKAFESRGSGVSVGDHPSGVRYAIDRGDGAEASTVAALAPTAATVAAAETADLAGAGAVRAASAKAASAAAGKVLIAEIPAIVSVLHVQLGVSKERVKRLVLRWPRLLEVGRLFYSSKYALVDGAG